MEIEDKRKANEWVIENYPDGDVLRMDDGKNYVEWNLLLELMVLYAGHCLHEEKRKNNGT
jgi:hypothetical protein